MARIELERKPRPVWPWIVGLLVLLVLGWVAWSMLGDAPGEEAIVTTAEGVTGGDAGLERPAPAPAGEVAGATGGAVERFTRTCAGAPAAQRAGGGAAYELACLRELTNALAGLVLADTTGAAHLDDELRDLRRQVQEAERDRITLEEEPGRFGEIAGEAVGLMEALERSRAPDGRISQEQLARTRRAAEQMGEPAPGDQARRSASEFFSAAAEVLRGMERSGRG